jgi:hypothetical protein
LPRSEIYPKIGVIFAAIFPGETGQVKRKCGLKKKSHWYKRDEARVLVVYRTIILGISVLMGRM